MLLCQRATIGNGFLGCAQLHSRCYFLDADITGYLRLEADGDGDGDGDGITVGPHWTQFQAENQGQGLCFATTVWGQPWHTILV